MAGTRGRKNQAHYLANRGSEVSRYALLKNKLENFSAGKEYLSHHSR